MEPRYGRLVAPFLVLILCAGSGYAQKENLTDNARVKAVLGKWQVGNSDMLVEFTENVGFVHDFDTFNLTFYKIDGLNAAYSIIGNSETAILFLKFADEEGFAQLDLTIKNPDLLVMVTTNGTTTEYHRRKSNKDLTDYESVKKLAGYWNFLDVSDTVRFLFTDEPYKVEKVPGSPNEVAFYRLSSPELGDLLEAKAYSVMRLPDGAREILFYGDQHGVSALGSLEIRGEVFLLKGKSFGRRPVPPAQRRAARDTGSLGVAVTYGEVLDLTVTEFRVQLVGDESTNFLRREGGSGSALFRSGYATFMSLPQGYYKMTLTGYVQQGGKKTAFAVNSDLQFNGGNVTCRANISTKRVYCQASAPQ